MLACRSASASASRQRSASTFLHHVEEVYAESSCRAQHRFIHSSASSRKASHDNGPSRTSATSAETPNVRYKQPKVGRKQQRALQHALQVAESLKKASLNDAEPSDHATVNTTFVRPTPSDENAVVDRTPEEQIAEILQDRPSQADLVPTPVRGSGRGNGESSYRKRYKTAFNRIATSFNVSQIKSIGGNSRNSRGNKAMHIQMIMDRAGWPVPQAPTKVQETETKLSSRMLDLPENELFLFLRDTKLVHDLIMNQGIAFEVVAPIEDNRPGAPRQVLRVAGNEEQLDKLTHVLRKRVEHMTIDDIASSQYSGFEPSTGLLRFISNVTGAHIDATVGEAGPIYRVSTMNPAKIALVRRCLQVAALRSRILPLTRSRSVLAPPARGDLNAGLTESFICSTLPFFSTPSMVIPWNHLANDYAEILYRLRRTGNWNSKPGKREVIHRDELVENGDVVVVDQPYKSLGPSSNTPLPLKSFVQRMSSGVSVPDGDNARKVTTTTFGYLLLRKNGGVPGDFLSSPIPGQWPGVEAQKRLHQADRSIFSPALTPSMIHNNLKNPPQHIRRLNYRSENGIAEMTFAYTYPAPRSAPSVENDSRKPSETAKETDNWLDKLDQMVADLEKKNKEEQEALAGKTAESDQKADVEQGESKEAAAAGVEKDAEATSPSSETALGERDWLAELEKSVTQVEEEEKKRQSDMIGTGESLNQSAATIEGTGSAEEELQPDVMEIIAEKSYLSEVDLLMPDRPIDARLAVRTVSVLNDVPEAIAVFFSSVVSQSTAESGKRLPNVEPPISVTIDDETYVLEKDEDLQIAESYAPGGDVILRSLSTKDMILGVERYTQHTELEYEGTGLPTRYWRELANVTRDVAPRAGSGITGQYLM